MARERENVSNTLVLCIIRIATKIERLSDSWRTDPGGGEAESQNTLYRNAAIIHKAKLQFVLFVVVLKSIVLYFFCS